MSNGYVRQSAGVILTGNTIEASHFNNEFNTLENAFDSVTGHAHDGSTGAGGKLPPTSFNGLSSNGLVTRISSTNFLARTATGTTNRLTVTNGDGVAGNPTFDISAAYVGQTSITTLGTVTTGTFSGTLGAISGATLTNLTAANISAGTAGINVTGNAATATALQNARTINGVSFDGTGNIVVTAAAGTLTGATLAAGVTASSLTSVGTLVNLTVTNPIVGSVTGNAATVTTNANLTGAVTSTGNATVLGSFTSAQLATALTDETGSGANVFGTSPTITSATLVTPALGTPASGVGTNITGLPIANLVSGTVAAGVGALATSGSLGNITSGTVTPLATTNGNFNHYTNNGAHTLAPPAGVCTMVIEILNGATAGAVTTSGFTKVSGDSFTTTNAEKFMCYITKSNTYSLLSIVALQ